MSVSQGGGVVSGLDPVNPAGKAECGEGLGIVAPVTIRAAETISEELVLARIQWDTRETVGVPELAGAELGAAAGVRA